MGIEVVGPVLNRTACGPTGRRNWACWRIIGKFVWGRLSLSMARQASLLRSGSFYTGAQLDSISFHSSTSFNSVIWKTSFKKGLTFNQWAITCFSRLSLCLTSSAVSYLLLLQCLLLLEKKKRSADRLLSKYRNGSNWNLHVAKFTRTRYKSTSTTYYIKKIK